MTDLRKFRIRLTVVIAFCAILILGIYVAVRNTEQIEKLKAQGKDYNVGFATVKPENGKDGESAYDIAKRRGFSGSEEEWLASLVSKPEDGLNAYQIAVIHGFTGSQVEWLASLKGDKGDSIKGDKGDTVVGANGLTPPCYFEPSQCRGADGVAKDGTNGTNGTNGRTTEYTCRENTTYWKYTDEDAAAWRPWFTVVSCSQPPPEEITE